MSQSARRVLVIGATSAIAEATCRRLAEAGDALFLVARSKERLTAVEDDLTLRGASRVGSAVLDVVDHAAHHAVVEEAASTLGGLDVVLVAHGILPDQRACQASAELTRHAFDVNAGSVMSLLTGVANRLEAQRQGTIVVLSSVAGDRGRGSNYVYGSAKAAVNTFLQGLRNRLHKSGVRVVTVKPGFVDSPMTRDFEKGLLWSQPDRIAAGIVRALDRPRDVVYLPWYWRWVMLVIRVIPERVFKRLSL
jgi:NADP-dependent 3-hydroxy acid dehydrogenase YdfG